MEDKRNLHLKVQELADCYATTDPLREMSALVHDEDKDEAALKWLALAALHAVNSSAEKISLHQTGEGKVKVTAKYRDTELPSPGQDIGRRIIDSVRRIVHVEKKEGKVPLALGIRSDSIEVKVKIKKEDDGDSISLKFS